MPRSDFNPRLREGGDHNPVMDCLRGYMDFNPRLREGGDIIILKYRIVKHKISIHASAKEATIDFLFVLHGYGYFNPRLREGGDETRF